ncbi:MAG: type II toxin-antitoxin system Phd/YefM family antitoxin [Thiohalomonadales bacterium]
MKQVNIHDAKTNFSKLVNEAAHGAEIIISKAGVPQAKLVPLDKKPPRVKGLLKGKIKISSDFDAPLPDDILKIFL